MENSVQKLSYAESMSFVDVTCLQSVPLSMVLNRSWLCLENVLVIFDGLAAGLAVFCWWVNAKVIQWSEMSVRKTPVVSCDALSLVNMWSISVVDVLLILFALLMHCVKPAV